MNILNMRHDNPQQTDNYQLDFGLYGEKIKYIKGSSVFTILDADNELSINIEDISYLKKSLDKILAINDD